MAGQLLQLRSLRGLQSSPDEEDVLPASTAGTGWEDKDNQTFLVAVILSVVIVCLMLYLVLRSARSQTSLGHLPRGRHHSTSNPVDVARRKKYVDEHLVVKHVLLEQTESEDSTDQSELELAPANKETNSQKIAKAIKRLKSNIFLSNRDIEEGADHDSHEKPWLCAICIDEFHPNDEICWSPNNCCNHVFHHDCIEQWLLKHKECPCCREDFLLYNSRDGQSESIASSMQNLSIFFLLGWFSSLIAQGFQSSPISRPVRTLGMLSEATDTMDADTTAFIQAAAQAVDLSNVQVHSLHDGAMCVTALRSVRNLEENAKNKFMISTVVLNSTFVSLPSSPCPKELVAQWRAPQPGSKLRASLLTKSSIDNPKKSSNILEVWKTNPDSLVHKISLPKKEEHGKVIYDEAGFGVPTWNSFDQDWMVYVAERSISPAPTPFWGDSSVNRGKSSTVGVGIAEHWGEQLSQQSPLLDLWLLHVPTGRRKRVANVPGGDDNTLAGGVVLGQPVFISPTKLVYTGWDAGGLGHMPRRLGMIYCRNRPSKLYMSDLSSLMKELLQEEEHEKTSEGVPRKVEDCTCLTPDLKLSRSPRLLSENIIVFLTNRQGFQTHDGSMELVKLDVQSPSLSADTLVPLVGQPNVNSISSLDADGGSTSHNGWEFPGIFTSQLPQNPIVNIQGDAWVVLTTLWGSTQQVVTVHSTTGKLAWIQPKVDSFQQDSSYTFQAQSESGDLLLSRVGMNQPASLLWISNEDLAQASTSSDLSWPVRARALPSCAPIVGSLFGPLSSDGLSGCSYHLIQTPVPSVSPSDKQEYVQSILMLPKISAGADDPLPLVVVPHGGPHSCTVVNYMPGYAFLCQQGKYALLFPNYRGSLGFGQDSVEALPTRIGSLDVQDVMAAVEHVVQDKNNRIDPQRVAVCGGSHGGFLTAHLCGQYPDRFRAAVMRNPVTNIASMVTASDIPDWCRVEVLGSYDDTVFQAPTSDELEKFWKASPAQFIQKVKAPTLMALGMKDLRVPPSQGLEWYHGLPDGTKKKLLVYPEDSHSLDQVTTEADHWINILAWFRDHL